MTHDEMIEVIQAHKEGKTIQYYDLVECGGWNDTADNDPLWDFPKTIYRVKPEPREVLLKKNGDTWVDADCIPSSRAYVGAIRFREVIDD